MNQGNAPKKGTYLDVSIRLYTDQTLDSREIDAFQEVAAGHVEDAVYSLRQATDSVAAESNRKKLGTSFEVHVLYAEAAVSCVNDQGKIVYDTNNGICSPTKAVSAIVNQEKQERNKVIVRGLVNLIMSLSPQVNVKVEDVRRLLLFPLEDGSNCDLDKYVAALARVIAQGYPSTPGAEDTCL